MSLARTALRMATVAALKGPTTSTGPTIAHNRVYDSRSSDFTPETFPDDAKPTVIVLTDEEEGEELSIQNGGPPFRKRIKLVIEFAMVQGFDIPLEEGGTAFVPGYPASDAEHEASLDLLEYQITRRLAYDLAPMPVVWRKIITQVHGHDCHRQTEDESGVKIAARILTWEVEMPDDQEQIYVTGDDAIPSGLDLFPEPMRSVAKALSPTSDAYRICQSLVSSIVPLQVGQLQGFDMTVDNTAGEEGDTMLDVTVEIRSALEVAQTVATGPNVVIDYAKGTYQQLILSANVSSVTIINWPPVGKTGRLILQVTNTGNFAIDTGAWGVAD
ncbi:MAG TPA: hypothetical protein VF491_19555, partial [Vicinamibacterales bacterium]